MVLLKNNLPVPSFVRLLVDVLVPFITFVIVTSPVPPKINPPVLVIIPLMVKVLVPELISVFILEEVAVVMAPDKVVAPFVLGIHMAPLPTPVPFKVNGSVTASAPIILTAAPLFTIVAALALPKAAAFLTLMAPLFTVVTPV